MGSSLYRYGNESFGKLYSACGRGARHICAESPQIVMLRITKLRWVTGTRPLTIRGPKIRETQSDHRIQSGSRNGEYFLTLAPASPKYSLQNLCRLCQ
jgi:hypothetical protein